MLSLLTTLTLVTSAPAHVAPPSAVSSVARADAVPLKECVSAYEAAFEAKDGPGCVALWRANPHWTAVALASDVEAAFAERQSGVGEEDVRPRVERALWGARQAIAAGQPLVADYVAALAGLDEYRQTLYQQSQAVYQRCAQLLKDEEHELGVTIAFESVERATDLGDWWGAAMAYTVKAECHRELGSFEDALIAYAQARNLYSGLGLVQNEQSALISMATMASALERDVRGRELVAAGLALGKRLEQLVPGYDDRERRVELLQLSASIEGRLGNDAAADAARAELKTLRR